MIEHLTQNEVGDYCQRRLCPAALLIVADHITECESCRQRIEHELNPDEAFFALRSEIFDELPLCSHTTAEEAAGYVDGTLAGEDLKIVGDHLASCELCAAAVDDLNAFRSSITTSLDREYRPAHGSGPMKKMVG